MFRVKVEFTLGNYTGHPEHKEYAGKNWLRSWIFYTVDGDSEYREARLYEPTALTPKWVACQGGGSIPGLPSWLSERQAKLLVVMGMVRNYEAFTVDLDSLQVTDA